MHTVVAALNGGKDAHGSLHPDTIDRVDAAMDWASAYNIGRVIMVGGDAESMCEYAAETFPKGPDPVPESVSRDTIEGAHEVKKHFLNPGDFLVAFTSDIHALRADWAHRRVIGPRFGRVHAVPTLYGAEDRASLIKRERLQLIYGQVKLFGVGPENDYGRQRRIDFFKFRGVDSPIARVLVAFDNKTNARAHTELEARTAANRAEGLTNRGNPGKIIGLSTSARGR